jgi:Pyrimidine dimer DNA glycosylase
VRLWSLHPRYLDPQGLVALWREALLARAVLRGATRGYTKHPQLDRFKAHPHPRLAINSYLAAVHSEATRRGYAFDRSKIGLVQRVRLIPVNSDQIKFEWLHLQRKLAARSPNLLAQLTGVSAPLCHPLFRRRPGPVASWERGSRAAN